MSNMRTENNFENEFPCEYFWCSWANDRNEEEAYEFLTWKLKNLQSNFWQRKLFMDLRHARF